MSSFQALNIDYENVAAEQEVDDTKELQIEDALKLYQAALKYHAEGPGSYEAAIGAYKELLESDIFKYPEAQAEITRSESFPEYEEMWIESYQPTPTQVVTTPESAPNTLPQIIYLSYKNHGRFLLDVMQWRVEQHLRQSSDTPFSRLQVATSARGALNAYSQALDKDDTDVELWRSSAAVAGLVGCNRIARFCLEAVLDMGEEGLDDILGLPNVEQTLSTMKLQEMARHLEDDLSLLMTPLSKFRRQKLGEILSKRLEQHTTVPRPSLEETAYSLVGQVGRDPIRCVVLAAKRDWVSAGEVILQQQTLIESGVLDAGPGVGIGIKFPEPTTEELEKEVEAAAAQEARLLQDEENRREKEALYRQAGEATKDAALVDSVNGDGNVSNEEEPSPENAEEQLESGDSVNRKRSTASAELNEDEGRGRSKRARKRDTMESAHVDTAKVNADWKLNIYRESDQWLFEATNHFLQKMHMPHLIPPLDLRRLVEDGQSAGQNEPLEAIIKEFYSLSTSCTPETTNIISHGLNNENIDSFGSASREAGFNAFLGSSSSRGSKSCVKPVLGAAEGLMQWSEHINSRWRYPKEAAWEFITALLCPGAFPGMEKTDTSSYLAHQWSDELKRCIVQMAVRFDEDIYLQIMGVIEKLSVESTQSSADRSALSQDDMNIIELTQTLFELHLDVYSLIKRPGTNVDPTTMLSQKYSLDRWSSLANVAINARFTALDSIRTDDLALRHIWATAFHISVCDEISQVHILNCMKDLKGLLLSLDEPTIYLQNNAVIPEISMTAIEQELSKVNMKDFFARIFSDRQEDPAETIETLEPLVELSSQTTPVAEAAAAQSRAGALGSETSFSIVEEQEQGTSEDEHMDPSREPTSQEQMSRFIADSTWTLRLSLWQRIRQAYVSIDYPPMVFSCHLRSVELLTSEMITSSDNGGTADPRNLQILRCIHLIGEFVQKMLHLCNTTPDIFACIDAAHLRSSITALVYLVQILHSFNLYEDLVRVGSIASPTFEGKPKPSFTLTAKWVHNLQARVWMLLYRLFQEQIEQFPEQFESPSEARFEYLRTLHYSMGQRHICSSANRELLRMLLDEGLKLSDLEYSDLELSQIVLDLYGLKFAPNPMDLMDHECTEHELLTRKAALKLLGFFMSQAQKVPMKDMPKSDIKSAVDKVQGALGKGRMSDEAVHNSRVFTSYMKSTVNPLDLFGCLRGTVELPTKPVPDLDAPVASKGWYFLLGSIALNKFKSTKRLQSGPCEDLMNAVAFFRQDIEYSCEHWESWYRLAQANDLHLEEHVSWSAEKLNNHAHEIFHYQRQALHAYVMATSCAVRVADNSPNTILKVAELYADFGNRIYSSSRDPFSMLAFGFQEKEERYFSGDKVYPKPPFKPLQLFTAWRLASVLFRRSIARAPDIWPTHYMLGKCLWKMYTYTFPEGSPDLKYKPTMYEVIDCFVNAVERLPKRDSKKEPILEPHYKLITIVHKFVKRKDLREEDAQGILQVSSYAAKILNAASGLGQSWTAYMMNVLRSLRSADKSGWHHRMTVRAAHLAYDDSPDNDVSAADAKHELTQQMFTKTMVLQVWKPEFERPGRHFVYTTRYVQFFVKLLAQLGDRESLGALAKRLRRKPDQYFNHSKLWQELCIIHLRLLRKAGSIPEGHEDAVFKSLNHEEFAQRSAKLELWCHGANDKSTTYEVLCEVVELKKVNNGLMKPTLIDDLVGDTYAKLYEEISVEKLEKVVVPKKEGSQTPVPTPPAVPAPKSMALTSVINLDGATDVQRTYTPPQPEAVVTKPRSKGVGRRELQRKAEAAANKPLTAGIPIRSNSISTPVLNQIVKVVIPSPRQSYSSGNQPGPSTPAPTSHATDPLPPPSPPKNPYLNDDSDSELSELSELEGSSPPAPPKPLFLNLLKGGEEDAESGASSVTARDVEDVDEAEEGDDGDDEEQEEDEGEEGEGEGEGEGEEDGQGFEEDDEREETVEQQIAKDGDGDLKMEDK